MKNRWITKIASCAIVALTLFGTIAPLVISQNIVKEKEGTPLGWSDDINISNYPQRDTEPSIAINNNDINLVWRRNTVSTRDIIYVKSTDCGKTWGQNMTLASSTDLATLPDIGSYENIIHVVWEDNLGWNGIYYRNSTNGGGMWNPTKRINSEGVDAIAPHLFVNHSNIHILWNDWRDGAGGEVYYRRSVDGGMTFDNGQGINQDRRISFSPSTVTAPKIVGYNSNISVAWMDERNGNFEIYWMISKDNGNTWEDGLGHVGQDRRLTFTGVDDYTIAVNGSKINIAWVEVIWPGPVYKIHYRNSTDNGYSWNSPQLLVDSNYCHAPDLAVYGNSVNLVWHDWRDDGVTTEIYYMNSTDGGTTWGPQTRLTYNAGNYSDMPKIVVDSDTRHIVWIDRRDGNQEIYYKRSPDFPDISPPSHSNEMPPPDSYKDPPGTTISVRVTDPSGVNASSIKLYVNGSLVTPTLTPIAGGYNVSFVSPGLHSGVIPCRIVANDTLGNHLDYTWSFTVLNTYKIPVVLGWNLISMPLAQPNSNLPSVLQDRDGDTLWDRAMTYNASDTTDHWKQYNKGWSTSLNDLTGVNNRNGLWLNVTNVGDGFLNVTGLLPTTTQISLRAGWNLVGYPTLSSSQTVGNAFWGTGADIVEVFDQSATYRTKVVGPSYIMRPGEAYWVHVPADSIWMVNG
jgi:hypothetical protein